MRTYLNFFMASLIGISGILIFQFLYEGFINARPILNILAGWLLGYIILCWARKKEPGTAWAILLTFSCFTPLVLFIIVLSLNKLLGLNMPFWVLMIIYLGALAGIFLIVRRIWGRMMTSGPWEKLSEPDERDLNHMAWSGLMGFVFLSSSLIIALLQPWMSYSDTRLWLAVLGAGMVAWLASLLVLQKMR